MGLEIGIKLLRVSKVKELNLDDKIWLIKNQIQNFQKFIIFSK
jgi:hypothetical protein